MTAASLLPSHRFLGNLLGEIENPLVAGDFGCCIRGSDERLAARVGERFKDMKVISFCLDSLAGNLVSFME